MDLRGGRLMSYAGLKVSMYSEYPGTMTMWKGHRNGVVREGRAGPEVDRSQLGQYGVGLPDFFYAMTFSTLILISGCSAKQPACLVKQLAPSLATYADCAFVYCEGRRSLTRLCSHGGGAYGH